MPCHSRSSMLFLTKSAIASSHQGELVQEKKQEKEYPSAVCPTQPHGLSSIQRLPSSHYSDPDPDLGLRLEHDVRRSKCGYKREVSNENKSRRDRTGQPMYGVRIQTTHHLQSLMLQGLCMHQCSCCLISKVGILIWLTVSQLCCLRRRQLLFWTLQVAEWWGWEVGIEHSRHHICFGYVEQGIGIRNREWQVKNSIWGNTDNSATFTLLSLDGFKRRYVNLRHRCRCRGTWQLLWRSSRFLQHQSHPALQVRVVLLLWPTDWESGLIKKKVVLSGDRLIRHHRTYLGFQNNSATVDVQESVVHTAMELRATAMFTSDGTTPDEARERAVESNTVSALPPSAQERQWQVVSTQ